MIRPMDLAMTVGAASVKKEDRSRWPRRHGVTRRIVARGAEPRVRDLEKPVIDGSVRLVAVGTVLKHRRMLPQKWPAPFGMAGVTVFIHAGLLELRRIGGAVRIVAVGTGKLAFSQRHVRRAIELGFSLQVALTANLGLSSLVKERRLLTNLDELILIGRLFHHLMAGDTSQPAARVRTGFPIGLDAALMATETRFVLYFRGLPRIFAKGDHPANAFAAASGNMGAARAVAILAGSFFCLITRVVQEDFSHHGLGKFFKGGGVAGLANFVADVGGGGGLGGLCFSRPDDPKRNQKY